MSQQKQEKAAGTVGFIFITLILVKILGQAREMAIAAVFGTSDAASAYVIASQLPVNFFDMILGTAVSSAFIPVFNKYLECDGLKRANVFASRFLNIIIIVSTLICAVGMVFAPQLINLFSPDMSAGAKLIASQLLRIMFPIMIFTGMAFSLVGVLQSLGEFKIPAIMSLISNALCIIYLFTLNKYFGIYGLAVTFLTGWAMQFFILILPSKKRGFVYHSNKKLWDDGLKTVATLALPVLLSSWVQPINAMVNMALASGKEGGIASLNYANRLYIIAASVFAVSITNYIFPKLSQMHVRGEKENWSKTVAGGLKYVVMIVLPMALVFTLQGKEIIRIVYQHGAFTETDVSVTSSAIFFYSLGMIFYSLQEICNKAFYSVQSMKTPMFAAIGSIATNVILSYILSARMGIAGLALAASIAACTWSIFMLIAVSRKMTVKLFDKSIFKTFAMCAGFGFAVFFVRRFSIAFFGETGFLTSLINFALPFLAGTFAYIILAFVLKIEETAYIRKFIRRN